MAVTPCELPPPGSSQMEVMFRRMLLHCCERVQLYKDADIEDWRVDPKLHCVVELLQEKLYELEQSTDRPGADILQQCKTCVKAVAEELRQPQLPAYCIKANSRAGATDASNAITGQRVGVTGGVTPGTATADALLRSRVHHAAAKEVDGVGHPSSTAADERFSQTAARPLKGQSAQAEDPSFSLSRSTQDKLQTQQRLQDELTTELLDMGQELKASTLAMQNAIRFRGKLLDDTEISLEHSTANAQSVSAKAKQQYKRSSWSFCQTCLLLLAMAVIFCGMIVYIKLTSMVGLKGRY